MWNFIFIYATRKLNTRLKQSNALGCILEHREFYIYLLFFLNPKKKMYRLESSGNKGVWVCFYVRLNSMLVVCQQLARLKDVGMVVKGTGRTLRSVGALCIFTIRLASFILKESRRSNTTITDTSLDTQGSFFVRDADRK